MSPGLRIRLNGPANTAELITIAGYCCSEGLINTSDSQRTPKCKISSKERPSWPRAMRKISDPRDPPLEPPAQKQVSFQEVDIYAAAEANKAFRGIGEICHPRQGEANVFSDALGEASADLPPYAPFVAPKLSGVP